MTTDSDYSVAILAYTAVELHTNAGCGLHLDGDLSFGLEPFGNLLDPFSTVGIRLVNGPKLNRVTRKFLRPLLQGMFKVDLYNSWSTADLTLWVLLLGAPRPAQQKRLQRIDAYGRTQKGKAKKWVRLTG